MYALQLSCMDTHKTTVSQLVLFIDHTKQVLFTYFRIQQATKLQVNSVIQSATANVLQPLSFRKCLILHLRKCPHYILGVKLLLKLTRDAVSILSNRWQHNPQRNKEQRRCKSPARDKSKINNSYKLFLQNISFLLGF